MCRFSLRLVVLSLNEPGNTYMISHDVQTLFDHPHSEWKCLGAHTTMQGAEPVKDWL
jgi:hypothetical protein